jgi:hypothetical protein
MFEEFSEVSFVDIEKVQVQPNRISCTWNDVDCGRRAPYLSLTGTNLF